MRGIGGKLLRLRVGLVRELSLRKAGLARLAGNSAQPEQRVGRIDKPGIVNLLCALQAIERRTGRLSRGDDRDGGIGSRREGQLILGGGAIAQRSALRGRLRDRLGRGKNHGSGAAVGIGAVGRQRRHLGGLGKGLVVGVEQML